MKAIRMHRHGGSEVLAYETCAEPVVRSDDVMIRVKACALNHLDIWVRRGIAGIAIPMPHILGSDIAGVVADVGRGVEHVRVGDEVVLSPGVSCGHCRDCLSGRDNFCRSYTLFGYKIDGGYAEYVSAPAQNVLRKPQRFSFSEAASFPLTFLTAWHMLVGRAGLSAGEDLLVLAAGSGVGSAAIQIGRMLGATIIATAGSDEKLEKAGELGADFLINHAKEDFSARVRHVTGKKGADVVFEHVGSATWERSILSLATGGRLVTCGATTGHDAAMDLRQLFARHLTIYGSYMGSKGEMIDVLAFADRG
ncbi:MAG: zinc-binding dehydrogenase, partial [Chitinivibrionia bacterium]|nr:zinc-binding dehydrogenase [Chitinivibrionia bacterium]